MTVTKDTTASLLSNDQADKRIASSPKHKPHAPGRRHPGGGSYPAKKDDARHQQRGHFAKSYQHPKNSPQRSAARPQPRQETPRGGEKLRVIPIGGCEEVGRNMTVFEYGADIIIVDMGLQWPEEDMPGIDYIIPNINYLKGKEKNIRGVVITHGHYDHIGAIPHLIPNLGNPTIYGTPLTLGIIAKRQEDYKNQSQLKLKSVTSDTVLALGKFRVSFYGVSHSIPGSLGVIIDTPVGKIIHTGDFKLDSKKSGDVPTEMDKIESLGRQNVLALMADSTNASQEGHQLKEYEIQGNIDKILEDAKARVIIGTFASLLGRLQQIIWSAEKLDKKVVIEGYSMKRNVELAQNLGYMKVRKGTLIQLKDMRSYPDNKIMILCTGAQGEDNAVLMRIANREHKTLKVEKGDTVVFSSSVIPGNERSVQRLKDNLYRLGAEVIHYKMMDVHAGGHAKQEDLFDMIKLVRPKYHIPVYGNHSFLRIHAKVAMRAGMSESHVIVPDNGSIIEFDQTRTARVLKEKVPSEYVFVDGLGVGQMMAADGMIVVIATVSGKSGRLIHSPDIISRGFIYMRENKEMVEAIRTRVKNTINEHTKTHNQVNDAYIKDSLRNSLGQFIYQKTQRRPMILPVVVEV